MAPQLPCVAQFLLLSFLLTQSFSASRISLSDLSPTKNPTKMLQIYSSDLKEGEKTPGDARRPRLLYSIKNIVFISICLPHRSMESHSRAFYFFFFFACALSLYSQQLPSFFLIFFPLDTLLLNSRWLHAVRRWLGQKEGGKERRERKKIDGADVRRPPPLLWHQGMGDRLLCVPIFGVLLVWWWTHLRQAENILFLSYRAYLSASPLSLVSPNPFL